MKAITVEPGTVNSVALEERPEPPADTTTLLAQTLARWAEAFERRDDDIKVVVIFDPDAQ